MCALPWRPTRASRRAAEALCQISGRQTKGLQGQRFSYNTGSLRCPGCDGTGEVSLDVQFLPDVNIVCPDCRGSRYARAAYGVKLMNKAEQAVSLPQLMEMDVNSALAFCGGMKTVSQRLQTLQQLGLGYLTLGEETPSLSGGEAQRLKLASEIGRTQTDSVFVFDEPSIGLHPLDVQVLLRVFQALLDNGATVVVIEHDLDVIRNADYVIDMGPGGGESGGRVVAAGTPEEIREDPESITGRYLYKKGADAAWHLPPSSIFLFAFRDTAQLGTEALGNIFFPDISDEIRKLCGFAYGIDHDALPMLR